MVNYNGKRHNLTYLFFSVQHTGYFCRQIHVEAEIVNRQYGIESDDKTIAALNLTADELALKHVPTLT